MSQEAPARRRRRLDVVPTQAKTMLAYAQRNRAVLEHRVGKRAGVTAYLRTAKPRCPGAQREIPL